MTERALCARCSGTGLRDDFTLCVTCDGSGGREQPADRDPDPVVETVTTSVPTVTLSEEAAQ